MPILKGRRFAELNQLKVGVVALLVAVLAVTGALRIGALERALFLSSHSAQFAQASGLRPGADVQVSGMTVGSVERIELEGTHVRVWFDTGDVRLGERSSAAIKTTNAVGTRVLQVTPAGDGEVDVIPLARTSVPYDLNSALSDITRTTEDIDVTQLSDSFDAVSEAFATSPEEIGGALDGLASLSEAVASRDQELEVLLQRATGVSGVLADRSSQIVRLLRDGNLLLDELAVRRQVIHSMLVNIRGVSGQLSGLVRENRAEFGPTLTKLNRVIGLLTKHEDKLAYFLAHLGGFARNLGESVGGGPFFYGYVQNVIPTKTLPVVPGIEKEDR